MMVNLRRILGFVSKWLWGRRVAGAQRGAASVTMALGRYPVHPIRVLKQSLVGLIVCGAAAPGWAVSIPILDPAFDIYTASTLNFAPDNILPNLGSPGAGSGPVANIILLDFNTFGVLGSGDIPAGWTATGQKPNGAANTGRVRCDACFLSPSGTAASINSFHDESDAATQGRFFQTLSGVAAQPHTHYTATIEVADLNIAGHGPFAPPDDNVVLGDPARIVLSLSVVSSANDVTDLGGTLQFTPITPDGFGTETARISGAKELLTLTLDTGASVPAGDLQIAFTAGGVFGDIPGTFAASAQTFFDNVTLDATPLAVGLSGDFNSDGHVDAADYVMWRHGTALAADYELWRSNFGATATGAAFAQVSGNVAGVPEPAAICTIFIAFNLLGLCRRRSERK
jgi:hypothetical protein